MNALFRLTLTLAAATFTVSAPSHAYGADFQRVYERHHAKQSGSWLDFEHFRALSPAQRVEALSDLRDFIKGMERIEQKSAANDPQGAAKSKKFAEMFELLFPGSAEAQEQSNYNCFAAGWPSANRPKLCHVPGPGDELYDLLSSDSPCPQGTHLCNPVFFGPGFCDPFEYYANGRRNYEHLFARCEVMASHVSLSDIADHIVKDQRYQRVYNAVAGTVASACPEQPTSADAAAMCELLTKRWPAISALVNPRLHAASGNTSSASGTEPPASTTTNSGAQSTVGAASTTGTTPTAGNTSITGAIPAESTASTTGAVAGAGTASPNGTSPVPTPPPPPARHQYQGSALSCFNVLTYIDGAKVRPSGTEWKEVEPDDQRFPGVGANAWVKAYPGAPKNGKPTEQYELWFGGYMPGVIVWPSTGAKKGVYALVPNASDPSKDRAKFFPNVQLSEFRSKPLVQLQNILAAPNTDIPVDDTVRSQAAAYLASTIENFPKTYLPSMGGSQTEFNGLLDQCRDFAPSSPYAVLNAKVNAVLGPPPADTSSTAQTTASGASTLPAAVPPADMQVTPPQSTANREANLAVSSSSNTAASTGSPSAPPPPPPPAARRRRSSSSTTTSSSAHLHQDQTGTTSGPGPKPASVVAGRTEVAYGKAKATLFEAQSCPIFLANWIEKDGANRLSQPLTDPAACRKANSGIIKPLDLETELAKAYLDPKHAGTHGHFLTDACRKQDNGALNRLDDAGLNRLVAEYYEMGNKLSAGELGTIEAIANLDKDIDGHPFASATLCTKENPTAVQDWCAKIKDSCDKPDNDLDDLIKDTEIAIEGIKKNQQFERAGNAGQLHDVPDIATIKATHPWLNGPHFKNLDLLSERPPGLKDGEAPPALREALKDQLRDNRRTLVNRLNTIRSAETCIRNNNCDESKLRLALSYSPRIEDASHKINAASDPTSAQLQCMLEGAEKGVEARDKAAVARKEHNDEIGRRVMLGVEVVGGIAGLCTVFGAPAAVMALSAATATIVTGVTVKKAVDSCHTQLTKVAEEAARGYHPLTETKPRCSLTKEMSDQVGGALAYGGPTEYKDWHRCQVDAAWAGGSALLAVLGIKGVVGAAVGATKGAKALAVAARTAQEANAASTVANTTAQTLTAEEEAAELARKATEAATNAATHPPAQVEAQLAPRPEPAPPPDQAPAAAEPVAPNAPAAPGPAPGAAPVPGAPGAAAPAAAKSLLARMKANAAASRLGKAASWTNRQVSAAKRAVSAPRGPQIPVTKMTRLTNSTVTGANATNSLLSPPRAPREVDDQTDQEPTTGSADSTGSPPASQ